MLDLLNFIAFPLVIAIVQIWLYWIILGRAGLARWTAFLPVVPVIVLSVIHVSSGFAPFYDAMQSIPLVWPLYELSMVFISFVPLFVLAFARCPKAAA